MKKGRLPLASGLLALASALGACSGRDAAREGKRADAPTAPAAAAGAPKETHAATPSPASDAATAPTPDPAPPPASDVRAAVGRVYKGAVALDARPGSAAVGDFNGDGSEDLAVRVRAEASRLGDLNDDLAN